MSNEAPVMQQPSRPTAMRRTVPARSPVLRNHNSAFFANKAGVQFKVHGKHKGRPVGAFGGQRT